MQMFQIRDALDVQGNQVRITLDAIQYFSGDPVKIFIVVSLIAASLVAQAADVPVMNIPTVNQRMKIVREAIAKSDWRTANFQALQVVGAEPGNADAHNLLAYTFRKQDRPDLHKAFEHYKIALRLNPEHRGAHEYIGEAYLMDRKPTDAEWHLAELERICGNRTCEEYQDLARAISAYR